MAESEIMTPVTKPEAVSLAEIHALRGLTDAVGSLTRQVEKMGAKVDDVRERVIKLETREYERQIENLNTRYEDAIIRINDLEATRDRQTGALGVGSWLTKYAPWLLSGVAAFAAGVGFRANGAG